MSREEQHLLVGERRRDPVRRRVGERDPRVLGLHAVDQMAEDRLAAGAEPVAPLHGTTRIGRGT